MALSIIILLSIYSFSSNKITHKADIIIYGGTSAALTAAVEAVKSGKTVLVASPDTHLGGLSSGGLGFTDTDDKIFYNTWNFQERNKHWNKKPYLAAMNLDRMLQEIEAAHKIGIDVFAIDTGWFEKTGDWQPSKARFPDGLKTVKAKLDSYGMKLGLWFNPTVAAVSSSILANNKDCLKKFNDKKDGPYPVWETEDSYGMCLVSRYWDAFADELIRLAKELGRFVENIF